MSVLFWGLTLKTIGEVIIGIAVIAVHIKMMKEHKFDRKVYRSIRNEKFWVMVGILLILAGYAIEVTSYTAEGLIHF